MSRTSVYTRIQNIPGTILQYQVPGNTIISSATIEWGAKCVRPLLDRFGPDQVISKFQSLEQRILHMKVVLHSRLGEPLLTY